MRDHSIKHGGNLVAASSQYHIPLEQWIDLSTGVNPNAYPVHFSEADFANLPYLQADFFTAVQNYYQQESFLAVAGTQAAIQVLPECLAELPVLLPSIGYQEHAQYWCTGERDYQFYNSLSIDSTLNDIENLLIENSAQHVVVINPNNPTGIQLSVKSLNRIASKLTLNACLIVDEAFVDVTPKNSLLNAKLYNNIIVLRSFGKFFGLAGLRLGFVFAAQQHCSLIAKRLGIWQVNGPAQRAAIEAFTDKAWQHNAIDEINHNAVFTQQIFAPLMDKVKARAFRGVSLFTSYLMSKNIAYALADTFAQAGILLRVIDIDQHQALLRVGILGRHNEQAVKRLTQLVNNVVKDEKIISI